MSSSSSLLCLLAFGEGSCGIKLQLTILFKSIRTVLKMGVRESRPVSCPVAPAKSRNLPAPNLFSFSTLASVVPR
jgi:hypothetical protein